MMQSPTENSKPKPSTLATVTAGFELVTSHLWLLILPLSLDLFLWLGPKLSAARIIKTSSLQFSADPAIRSLLEQLLEAADHFNLFSILSLPVIGVPALMSSDTPELLPLIPYHWNVSSASSFLLIYLGLLLAGLFLSVLYLGLITRILRDDDQDGGAFLRHLGSFISESAITWLRLLLFGIFLFATMMMLMLPLIPVMYLSAMVSQDLALVVLLVAFLVLITYLSMAVPTIVFDRKPVGVAIVTSLRMVRHYLRPTITLIIVVLLISWGTKLLWRMADSGTWLTLVSLVGNAFISTALACAVFIYYRDRSLYPQVRGN